MNIMVLGGGTEEDGHEVWHRMTVAVMHTKAWEEAGPYGGVGVSSKAQVPSSKKKRKGFLRAFCSCETPPMSQDRYQWKGGTIRTL